MALFDSILITGGGGMLAHAMIHALKQRNRAPAALSHRQLDITDADALAARFTELRPSLLINCAAYTRVDQCEAEPARADAVNGDAVALMAGLCQQFNTKLVHFSTDFVFDGTKRQPYTPANPTRPASAYGRSKLLGEQAAARNPDVLIIRTAWLYGPGGPCFPRTMVEMARQKKPLAVVNDQIGSPTFTYDLAEAMIRLLDAGVRGIYHVVNQGAVSWFDFARAVLEEFDEQTQLTAITSEQWRQKRPESAVRPAYSVLDVSAYHQTTGHRMRPWRQALRDYRLEVARGGF